MPKYGDRTPGEAMFKGSFTALITPMRKGEVDERAFQDLVEWQIAEGTHGLVPVGTTGESPTLSHEEHMRVVELCIVALDAVRALDGTGERQASQRPVPAVLIRTSSRPSSGLPTHVPHRCPSRKPGKPG